MQLPNRKNDFAKPRLAPLFLLSAFATAVLGVGLIASATFAQNTAAKPASGARPTAPSGPPGNLAQMMRGILFPASNVIFAAQNDITNLPKAEDPTTSPNPLTSNFGGWLAVESASIAVAEGAALMNTPGRLCSNGKPVPYQRPDWQKYVRDLRQAGLVAYKAAQTKNTDKMTDAAGTVSDACAACHMVYRDKPGGLKDRCTP